MKRMYILGVILSFLWQRESTALDKRPEEGSCSYLAPTWQYLHSHWGDGTKQGGSMWGVSGGYSYIGRDSLYFVADFSYAAGMLRGSAGDAPTQEYITQMRIGYNLVSPLWSGFTLAPFVGMGSYIFNQTLFHGPNFQSHFWYVPLGVAFQCSVTRDWLIGLTVSGAPTFAGWWKTSRGHDAPTTVLWKGELPVTYLGAHPFTFTCQPFIRSWAYSPSGALIKQINNYYGLQVLLGYHF